MALRWCWASAAAGSNGRMLFQSLVTALGLQQKLGRCVATACLNMAHNLRCWHKRSCRTRAHSARHQSLAVMHGRGRCASIGSLILA